MDHKTNVFLTKINFKSTIFYERFFPRFNNFFNTLSSSYIADLGINPSAETYNSRTIHKTKRKKTSKKSNKLSQVEGQSTLNFFVAYWIAICNLRVPVCKYLSAKSRPWRYTTDTEMSKPNFYLSLLALAAKSRKWRITILSKLIVSKIAYDTHKTQNLQLRNTTKLYIYFSFRSSFSRGVTNEKYKRSLFCNKFTPFLKYA